MARYYKRSYKKYPKESPEEEGVKIIVVFSILYIFGIIYSFKSNPALSWKMIFLAIGIFIFIWFLKKEKIKAKEKRKQDILNFIREAKLEEDVNNLITRFGSGQEKNTNVWTRRNYKISWDRINDFKTFLDQKGIKLSSEEMSMVLAEYIDKKEYNLTINSIAKTNNSFGDIKWYDFERLLCRLYESMGYVVQLTGKTGDQGGDLVATKNQERILIQAKFYKDWSVGNKAVQEAAAAKNHYDCNKAIVITTSVFTKEATELAKTNHVELIPKNLLQTMLMDSLKESWN